MSLCPCSRGRLKAKRKGVKEAERRARHATSKVRLLGEGGKAQAGGSYSPGAGSSKPPTAGSARPAAAKATPTTAAGDVGVWEDEGSGSGNNSGKEVGDVCVCYMLLHGVGDESAMRIQYVGWRCKRSPPSEASRMFFTHFFLLCGSGSVYVCRDPVLFVLCFELF